MEEGHPAVNEYTAKNRKDEHVMWHIYSLCVLPETFSKYE